MTSNRVLIVVPTLGRRPEYLEQCLESIHSQSVPADIVIVAPDREELRATAAAHGAMFIPDPGSFPAAVNLGVAQAQATHEYVNWLGDDDLLEPESLAATTAVLDSRPDASVAYGACRYIDDQGRPLWVSAAGKWADRVLAWGPDLIPQPGMLVRRRAWEHVGGVSLDYRFAFDLDLLLRLRALGPLLYTGTIVSSFRWHPDSMTVGDRDTNLRESELAKRRALSPAMRRLAPIWEAPVRIAIRLAAKRVTKRAVTLREQSGSGGTK